MIFAAIFTCYPVSDVWSFEVLERELLGPYKSQCYNTGPFWLFNAVFNLVTDILIWTLPILCLLNLQTIPLRRRVELIAIFSIGIMALAASAVRLYTMVLWLIGLDIREEYTANLLLWSQVEQHTGVIAASIPFLRPIFRKALTRVRSRGQGSPTPAARLVEGGALDHPGMFRTPIIPSPSPTFGTSDKDFMAPHEELVSIQPMRGASTWGSEIWDGTQVRQVLSG